MRLVGPVITGRLGSSVCRGSNGRAGVLSPNLAHAVERGGPCPDQPALDHHRGKGSRAHPIVDGVELSQQSPDLWAPVTGEVGTNPRMEIGCLAHIEDVAGGVGEPVDAGPVGESGGETKLGRLRVADKAGEVEELLESEDPE